MYSDPKRVRDNRVTLYLDDYEHDLVQALANYKGEQLGSLLRDMVMAEAGEVLDADTRSVEQRAA